MTWRDILLGAGDPMQNRVSRATGHQDALQRPLVWGIFFGSLLLLLLTSKQGFVRDEGYYFYAAQKYHAFFEQLWQNLASGNFWQTFSDSNLRHHFGYNTEHPGFVKILMGFTWKISHGYLGILSSANGFRLGPMLMVSLGNVFIFLFASRLWHRGVGILAVILFMASPHVFYHSHLACFDGPINAMTVISAYTLWLALVDGGVKNHLYAGVAFGVALATKHNAVFLLGVYAIAYGLWAVQRHRAERSDGSSEHRLLSLRGVWLPPIPLVFVCMLLLGVLVLYLTYPYGWHDPVRRLGDYYRFHLYHEHYPVDYLGTLYTEPPFPWHFPFVFSMLTIPVLILLPGLLGIFQAVTQSLRALWLGHFADDNKTLGRWLFLGLVAYPPILIAMPTVPIFGGTKHWMTMMPFFAMAAAVATIQGFSFLYHVLGRMGARDPTHRRYHFARLVFAALVLACAGHLIAEPWRAFPVGHTYFNEIVAGAQGGASLRMPRTFWGGDGRALLPELNARAKRGAKVFTDRLNRSSFSAYQRDGLLRSDLRWVGSVEDADWALINHQREYRQHEFKIWTMLGHRRPNKVLSLDGIRLASLYALSVQSPP